MSKVPEDLLKDTQEAMRIGLSWGLKIQNQVLSDLEALPANKRVAFMDAIALAQCAATLVRMGRILAEQLPFPQNYLTLVATCLERELKAQGHEVSFSIIEKEKKRDA